jgi:hypothetical protein
MPMSEYQYYEFLALDQPLTDRQMRDVRSFSTRARITSTSFVNEYHWAFVYFATWGSGSCISIRQRLAWMSTCPNGTAPRVRFYSV